MVAVEKGQQGSQDSEFGHPSSQKHSLAVLHCFSYEVQVQVLPETWSEGGGEGGMECVCSGLTFHLDHSLK